MGGFNREQWRVTNPNSDTLYSGYDHGADKNLCRPQTFSAAAAHTDDFSLAIVYMLREKIDDIY